MTPVCRAHLELSNVKNIVAALVLCVPLVWLPVCGEDENQPQLASGDLHGGGPLNWEGVLDPAWQSKENVQWAFMV